MKIESYRGGSREMKLKWVLLVIGLAAGIALIGLGTLIISENFRATLMEYYRDWGESTDDDEGYILMQPSKDFMRAGVLITASGTVAVSVSLASMIMFWERKKHIDMSATSKEE
jgi:hypothetical protein